MDFFEYLDIMLTQTDVIYKIIFLQVFQLLHSLSFLKWSLWEFSPDVILCGWLGLKHHWTN